MSTVFPLVEFVTEIAGRPGVTDLTLSSDGRVAMRQNARIAVRAVEPLRELWAATVAGCFPARPSDRRHAHTAILESASGRRLRATLSADCAGESIAVRLLPESASLPADLGLPGSVESAFMSARAGLFLIAGCAGAGKSTTLAALLRRRAQARGGKLVCLEDPVEVRIEGNDHCLVVQREVGCSVASYAEGLREALLMDPDLIAVQELRDREAAESALSAALSGHLVVATLNAAGAVPALQRLLALVSDGREAASARETLALCLEGVLAQRLVPGYDRLVPLFEFLAMREGERRLPVLERLLRQANWAGLMQELESGSRPGLMTWEQSRRQAEDAGLLPCAGEAL